MTTKEERLLLQLLGDRDYTVCEKLALTVHATFVANGFWPEIAVVENTPPGCVSLLGPNWNTQEDVFAFEYIDGVEVKCVKIDSTSVSVNAVNAAKELFSLRIRAEQSSQQTIAQLLANIVRPLQGKSVASGGAAAPGGASILQPQFPSSSGSLEVPRRPRGRPGELVGPNHPIFTGGEPPEEPGRFDPIGPGNVGEPWNDEFAVPGFGQPPGRRQSRRTPLRGPGANIGPGDMFM